MPVSGATSYGVWRFTGSTAPTNIVSGVTATNYTDTTVSPGQTNYYLVAAVNACNQSSYSPFASVGTPFSPPAAPTNLIATSGNGQVNLSWAASFGATSYNVKRSTTNGGPYVTIQSDLTTNYLDAAVTDGTTYYYVVSAVVSGSEGSYSAQVSATPNITPGAPPFLLTQPASQTNYIDQTATLSATATSVPPLYYQWCSGATGSGVYTNLIAGGQFSTVTNSTLVIPNLAMGNAADYVVVVTNSNGSTTSSVATLTVLNTAASITTQPVSQTNYIGQTTTLSVTTANVLPGYSMYYQWCAGAIGSGVYTNLIAGGQFSAVTNATLTVSNLVAGNAADYVVVVGNSYGSITSVVARLTISPAPFIITPPASQTNYVSLTAALTVTAAGLQPLSYQWQAGTTGSGVYTNLTAGGQFSAVTNSTLTLSNLVAGNAADYVVVVSNASGSITSAPATLTVLTLPPYQTTILADHPVSYWPFNETNGTVIHDLVGTNNGTCMNTSGLTLGGPGILYSNGVTTDTAIYFNDANSGYIQGPYSSTLNTPQLTVEAWLKMPTFPDNNAGTDMNPLSFNNANSPSGWAFEIPFPGNSNPQIYGWLASGGWTQISAGICIQSKWAYYVLTYNGATFSIYTNGVLANSSSSSYTQVSSGHPLYFGAYNDSGVADRFYLGGMEKVAVYSNALTLSQITNHYFYGTNYSSVSTSAPSITTQPASQTNYTSQTATFAVTAGGTAPLSYQWRVASNGVYANLNAGGQFSSVTNATLTISSLVMGNATNYEVVVTNSAGSVTSTVAMLIVLNSAPSITTQPASRTNSVGQTATFTVSASGLSPLSYQWQFQSNGVYANLNAGGQFSGVTNATLTISNLVMGNATNYEVVVTNSSGSVTSAVATLTVLNGTPSITTQPASQTNYLGQTNTFSVTAAGPSPLSYQWRVQTNGVYANLNAGGQFSGVTNATLTISSLVMGNGTNYDVVVSNSAGSVTSAVATLTVLAAVPSITTQPASQTNYVGQAATFTVTAAGLAPLSYQWRVGVTGSGGPYTNLIAGGQFSAVTNATMTISNLAATNAADYVVVVTNASGSMTSAVATLTVLTNSSYRSTILADHPVSYWPLNETSGTVIHDAVGSNNGTCMNTNGLTLGGPGILYAQGVTTDTAIYFNDAKSGYINVPYSSTLNTSQFTVEVWLKMPNFPDSNASANMNPLSLDNANSPNGWAFEIPTPNGSNPQMDGWLASGGWTQISGGTCIQSQWSYYALTYNGTTFCIYTNGVLVGSSSSTFSQVGSGHPLYFGAYDDSGTADRFYLGGMENVAFYSNALSASHILTHYQAGTNAVLVTQPTMSIQKSGSNITVSWTSGFLQKAASPAGPWLYVTNMASPCTMGTTNPVLYFRATLQSPP